jgi:hypothetical protein
LHILVGIDDTDNIESRGTGALASLLSAEIENRAWGWRLPVTRHQMLIHPDIPYTSHNSSMCFPANIKPEFFDHFAEFSQSFLRRESAPGSDPGLCIVNKDALKNQHALIDFGFLAKKEVIQKDEAYALARNIGIHLSEHGGTGLGVIGAMAGCGLRLTGNDGRFRGHFKVKPVDGCLKASELIRQTGVDLIQTLAGDPLDGEEVIHIGKKVKSVLLDGRSIILVFQHSENGSSPCWKTCTKEQLRVY